MHKVRKGLLITFACVVLIGIAGAAYVTMHKVWPPDTSTTPATPTPPTPPVPQKKTALQCVEALPNKTLLGQKLMPALYASQIEPLRTYFAQAAVGGVIVMNEIPPASITEFKQGFSIAPTIAIDQEGGTVQRYKSEGLVPGATDMATTSTAQQAHDAYYRDAKYLASIGITTNFGPVVDVISAEPSPLPGRMYSKDPSVVSTYASQFIQASQKAGVTPVAKHFPGLGSTTTNTDNGSATTAPLATLKGRDILPYQALAQYHSDVMVNNAIVPDLTDGGPAIWSSAAVSLLRGLGYENSVLYTDSLTAKAVPGLIQDAVIKTWAAGIDVALIVQTQQDVTSIESTLAGALSSGEAALQSGELTRDNLTQSVVRILQRKQVDPCTLTTQ